MSHLWPRLAVLVLLAPLLVNGCCPIGDAGQEIVRAATPQEERALSYDLDPLTDLVQHAVDTTPLEGASLLLIKDGQVIYERAFGSHSLETALPIASGSKWLTAAVIMALVDDGLVALDDPVSKHLPDFSGDKGAITIRQLLSHTSGLPAFHPCLDNPSTTLAQCVTQIARAGLASTPGTKFAYGSSSFQVAGRVAEVTSGRPWAILFEEKIKGPLDMAATTFGVTQNPTLAGGAVSTLRDYGNFLQMQLGGGVFGLQQVLSPASVREMQRDQTRGAPIAISPHRDGRRYGLGAWLDAVDPKGNALQLSCQGDTGFSPWIDRRRNLAGVFLVDGQLGNVYGLAQQIQQRTREIVDAGEQSPSR